MREPDPILILDNDRNVVARYDPTLKGGDNVEGSYIHTRNELDLAREEKRIGEAQYRDEIQRIQAVRSNYLASLVDYNTREINLEVGIGDVIQRTFDSEEMLSAMNDAASLVSAFRSRQIYFPTRSEMSTDLTYLNTALATLESQLGTLESMTLNLKKAD